MSLINEALKKAQRQRNAGSVADATPAPGGGRIAKRGQAPSANSMLLIGTGALVLVVLSVVVTVYLLNRPSAAPAPVVAQTPSTNRPNAATDSPLAATPVITAPVISPSPVPAASPPSALAGNSKSASDSSKSATPTRAISSLAEAKSPSLTEPMRATPNLNPSAVASTPATAAPREEPALPPIASAPAAPPAELVKPDERIYQYVDALRITGVKAAGNDSRLLMNDRVYRVNDIVERSFSLRLIKVETNTLTFSDAAGAIYVKNF